MKRQFHAMAVPQRGVVLPLVAIGLVVLIGMSGLALDLGHAYVNKTRLQNALDAAALSGAKTLDITSNTTQATTAARNTFDLAVGATGNQELDVAANGSDLTVEFSNTLFAAGTTPAQYIRVRLDNFTLPTWFVHVLPGVANTLTVGASAVAGPSPKLAEVCDLVPVTLCAALATEDQKDYLGYEYGTEYVLKAEDHKDAGISAGNYRNIDLPDCGTGGDCIRDNWAGKYSGCVNEDGTVTTKTGQNVGPNYQGLNSRFDLVNQGGLDSNLYKPDQVNDAGQKNYPDTKVEYDKDYADSAWDFSPPTGAPYRRVVSVPIVDCSQVAKSGKTTVPLSGIACVFLTRPANQGQKEIYGAIIKECPAHGNPGSDPFAGPGPHIIQLYKDPDSPDA